MSVFQRCTLICNYSLLFLVVKKKWQRLYALVSGSTLSSVKVQKLGKTYILIRLTFAKTPRFSTDVLGPLVPFLNYFLIPQPVYPTMTYEGFNFFSVFFVTYTPSIINVYTTPFP